MPAENVLKLPDSMDFATCKGFIEQLQCGCPWHAAGRYKTRNSVAIVGCGLPIGTGCSMGKNCELPERIRI